jgi:hypothetical protein
MESDNDKDAEDDNEEVAAGEEDATPNLFQNHMQVEENLAEITAVCLTKWISKRVCQCQQSRERSVLDAARSYHHA